VEEQKHVILPTFILLALKSLNFTPNSIMNQKIDFSSFYAHFGEFKISHFRKKSKNC